MITDPTIMRTHDAHEHNLYIRAIMGLNIFDANGLSVPLADDPIFNFLQALSVQFSCSAHVGRQGLKDIIDSPEQLFGSHDGKITYVRTSVGVCRGTFYAEETVPDALSLFFPKVNHDFWSAKTHEGDSVEYTLRRDALALYVDSSREAISQMLPLLNPSVVDEVDWLQQMTDLYSIVITTDYDGWVLVAYSKSFSNFDKLALALEGAVDAIQASDWYSQNSQCLRWDTNDECLKLIRSK